MRSSEGKFLYSNYSKNDFLKLALLALPIIVFSVYTFWSLDSQPDDALIYLRYIRNFHEGIGLTYNEAQNFNGLTSPLYTALLLFGGFFVSNLEVLTVVVSAGFYLAAFLLGARLFARNQWEVALCATALACTGYFYITLGMETGLFLFLISYSLWLYREDSPWFVVALALCAITRTEGVFLGAVLGVDYLIRHRALPNWRLMALGVVIFILPLVFNAFYYGEVLPSTANAKIAQGQSGLWGEGILFLNVIPFGQVFFSASVFTGLFLVLALCLGLALSWRNRLSYLVFLFLCLLLAFYTVLNIPGYHWYYAPFVYFVIMIACRGVWRLGDILLNAKPKVIGLPILALLASSAFYTQYNLTTFLGTGVNKPYMEMGQWLEQNTPEDSSVAMVEIGTVGWYSRRPIVDILGLVNPYNAAYIGERKFMNWLLHYQPDYIIRHDPIWGHEQSIAPIEREGLYVPNNEVAIEGLVLLQRAPGKSDADVVGFVEALLEQQEILKQMQQSSDVLPPSLAMEADGLFAHAPIQLTLALEGPADSLELEFGIREGAQGLHHNLCFSVVRLDSEETIFNQCIERGATAEEMRVRAVMPREVAAGEALRFDISCETSCDYAWTYWSLVSPVRDSLSADSRQTQ